MTEKSRVPIYIVMDANSYYGIGASEETALGDYVRDYGLPSGPMATVNVTVLMAPPAVVEGPTIDIPDSAGTVEQVEAEAAE
jgi:hypothetical protein